MRAFANKANVSQKSAQGIMFRKPAAAKLRVNTPGDVYEQEADRIAEHVIRMPEPGAAITPQFLGAAPEVRRACFCGGSCGKCQVEQGYEHEQLQTKHVGSGDLAATAAPPAVHDVLRSPGQPLDPATRAFFEPRFGHDFGRVRIHNDERAVTSARAVNASAYTVGKEVVFGAAQFAPHTIEGRKTLAHELTHVVQQSHFGPDLVQRDVKVTVEPDATCNLKQHRKIEPAAFKAADWLSHTIHAIDAFVSGAKTKPAVAAAAALSKHFHSTDAAVVAYVKVRLETIQKDIFSRENFTVNCPPASDRECGTKQGTRELVAVVPEGNPNEINFCRPFFERGEEDGASTIIHEFGHAQLGLRENQRMVDRGYKWDKYYPYLTTGEALTNAESYAMFAREVATGSSPAPGPISDKVGKSCPTEWVPHILDAMAKARMWNHRAALSTPASHEFSKAYKLLDGILTSKVGFKCILDGGGRCPTSALYWYVAGDLRICPSWRQLSKPDDRAITMLAALYGYKDLLDGEDRREKAAIEARRLHAARVPSTAEVIRK